MTEIDKMFENAGIKKCNRMLPCPFENKCKDCEFNWYPDFTSEKQLNIIKLISKQGQIIIENWEKDNRGFNVTFRANSNLRYITMDLDDDILDHEGMYCNHFEEYIEDSENVENN